MNETNEPDSRMLPLIQQFTLTEFNDAAVAFARNPNTGNWQLLERAMLVHQQAHSNSSEVKVDIARACNGRQIAQWPGLIVEVATGKTIEQALRS